jgi:hypothetical protein
MTRRKALVAAACGLLMTAGQATAVTIDFENLAEGATLSNQYAGLGVIFSPNAFSGPNNNSTPDPWATNTDMTVTVNPDSVFGGPALVSGKMLHSNARWFLEDGDPSMLLTFSTPINFFSADFASIFQFTSTDTLLVAYNGSAVVGTVVAPVCATTTCQATLSFAAPSITRVALVPGSLGDFVAVDNITFTPATAVPEVSTYAMMALGMGLLAFRRRRG